MVPNVQQRSLIAGDGTRIGYQVRDGDGPTIVLANGLGGTYVAYRHLYAALPAYRIISWDYRGLYTSAPPRDRAANTIAHQARDLVEIVRAEAVQRFVVVGWSMGVQVALELFRQSAEAITGLVAINGTSGKPFHAAMPAKIVSSVIPALLRIMRQQAALVGRASNAVAGSSALVVAMKRFGLVAEHIDMDVFRYVASGFRTLDWAIYSDLLARLDQHDASDLLPQVKVPTLIVTGDKDVMIPAATARAMHQAIPHSRLLVIPGGTHYTPVEYPEVIGDAVIDLLATIPDWRDWARPSAAPAAGGAR